MKFGKPLKYDERSGFPPHTMNEIRIETSRFSPFLKLTHRDELRFILIDIIKYINYLL